MSVSIIITNRKLHTYRLSIGTDHGDIERLEWPWAA